MSNFDIQIADQQQVLCVDAACLRRTVAHVLDRLEVRQARISLALVDDAAIKELKQRYFGRAEVTDVLSFDLRDDDTHEIHTNGMLDCEIVVNAERAEQAGRAQGGDPQAELHLYVVHGLLHQLGYDDQSSVQARKMHKQEDRLLEELGFGKVFCPEQ